MAIEERVRRGLKSAVESAAGVRVMRELPGGVDIAADIARWLPGFEIRVVFDVGANRGQSARSFLAAFPSAEVHSFEPSAALQVRLREEMGALPRMRIHPLALGASEREQTFVGAELVAEESAGTAETSEVVRVATLDGFCERHGIDRIGFLKIDTEGHDLEVLRGAERMLAEERIDLLQVEAGMNPRNTRHVPFHEFVAFLEPRGYYLFGFYDQQHEWSGEPQLRRADAAFVSPRLWRSERWR